MKDLVRNNCRFLCGEAVDRFEISGISGDECPLVQLGKDMSELKFGCKLLNILLQLAFGQMG